MSLQPTTGHLNPESPRAELWKEVFGGLDVPLCSMVDQHINFPDGPKRCYMVDVKALSPEQRQRVIAHLAHRHGIPAEEVAIDLDDPDQGLPILAEDLGVTFDARLLL